MKKLYLATGCTNHTPATITQLMKMGVKPEQLVVVDDNQKKHGWLAATLEDAIGKAVVDKAVILPYFCPFISELNRGEWSESVTDNVIYTKISKETVTDTWDKSQQYEALFGQDDPKSPIPNNLHIPDYQLIDPNAKFVRPNRGHGGKESSSLAKALASMCPVFITENVDKTVYNGGSITVQAIVENGKVVGMDSVFSKSYFTDYSDSVLESDMSEDLFATSDFTPYLDGMLTSLEATDYELSTVVDYVVECLGVVDGIAQIEFFTNKTCDKFFYIETNFRSGDIGLAMYPQTFDYIQRKLRDLGVLPCIDGE